MHLFPTALLLSAFALSTAYAQDPTPAPVVPALPIIAPATAAKAQKQDAKPVYDEKADARKDIAAAVARAKKENKRVLIQWGGNWCGWCILLARTMETNRELHTKLQNEYEVVHADSKHKELAKELGAEFKSVPFLTILDANGKPLAQQNTEPFETKTDGKNGHDPKKVVEFLTTHECKPLVAQAVLDAGFAIAKQQQKRVFLHFGAPSCGYCNMLDAWMSKPEIAAVLTKDFVDVKIDTERMTGGEEVLLAQLAAAGEQKDGIPWIVFSDCDGKRLATSKGPKRNTGFPTNPDEIVHFVTMLNAAKVNITSEDVEMLRASLEPKPAKKAAGGTDGGH